MGNQYWFFRILLLLFRSMNFLWNSIALIRNGMTNRVAYRNAALCRPFIFIHIPNDMLRHAAQTCHIIYLCWECKSSSRINRWNNLVFSVGLEHPVSVKGNCFYFIFQENSWNKSRLMLIEFLPQTNRPVFMNNFKTVREWFFSPVFF